MQLHGPRHLNLRARSDSQEAPLLSAPRPLHLEGHFSSARCCPACQLSRILQNAVCSRPRLFGWAARQVAQVDGHPPVNCVDLAINPDEEDAI